MKSKTLPSFWKHYEKLEEEIKKQARKALNYGKRIHFILHYISSVEIQKKRYGH